MILREVWDAPQEGRGFFKRLTLPLIPDHGWFLFTLYLLLNVFVIAVCIARFRSFFDDPFLFAFKVDLEVGPRAKDS